MISLCQEPCMSGALGPDLGRVYLYGLMAGGEAG
jgi:hypothetical protein